MAKDAYKEPCNPGCFFPLYISPVTGRSFAAFAKLMVLIVPSSKDIMMQLEKVPTKSFWVHYIDNLDSI